MTARIHTFRGVPAVTLSGGDYRATFLPELGMLGTSLRWRDNELLSLHGGLDGWRGGHTTGMPLLAPWANRLGGSRFKVGRKQLDLTDAHGVHVDANGSPIHGLLLEPTNALLTGEGPWVLPGERFAARFHVHVDGS